jgi:hypothetical protein
MSVGDFIGPEEGRAKFRRRLRDWKISDEPLATAIIARSESDIGLLVAHETDTDFYVPGSRGRELSKTTDPAHTVWQGPGGGVFLLAKGSTYARRTPLPRRW